MTIGTRTAGAWAYGSTSVATNLPTSVAAGDMMILFVGCKPYNATIAQPSGWTRIGTQQTNGTTASGTDTGSVTWTVFYRQFQTGDTAPTVSITSGGTACATIFGFTKTQAAWSTPTAYFGADTSAGTGYSVTAASSATYIQAGDYLCAGTIISGNDATLGSPTCSATGATIGTVTQAPSSNGTTNTGDDCAASGYYAPVSAGHATANAVVGYTLSAAQTGGSALVVLREVNRDFAMVETAATLTGKAPTPQWTDHRTFYPQVGAAALTGRAPVPVVAAGVTDYPFTPQATTLTATGRAPTAHRPEAWFARSTPAFEQWARRYEAGAYALYPSAGALAATGQAPTPVVESGASNITRAPEATSVALTGNAPTAGVSYTFAPQAGTLAASSTALTYSILAGELFNGVATSLTVTGYAPDWGVSYTLAPQAGAATLTGYAPTLTVTQIVQPQAGAATLTGNAPTLAQSYVFAPQATTLEASSVAAFPSRSEMLLVTFPFATTAQGFTATAGAGTAMAWTGTDGNAAGSLQTRTTGKNRNAVNSWELVTDWTTLGIPADKVITGITLASTQSKVTEWTTGAASTVDAVTLTPTGYPAITLGAARSVSAIDANWVTSSGVDATGLEVSSNGSLTIHLGSNLKTGNSNSAAVTLRQDNVTFRIDYTSSKVSTPQPSSATITGYAPQLEFSTPLANYDPWFPRTTNGFATWYARGGVEPGEYAFPEPGTLAFTGYAPELNFGNPTFHPQATELAVTGLEATFTGPPIALAGADYLVSEVASVTSSGVRIITGANKRFTPTATTATLTGQAPTVNVSYLFRPPATALTATGQVPGVARDYTVEGVATSLALTGLVPAALVGSPTFYGVATSLSLTGYAPTVRSSQYEFSYPTAGAAEITGYAPTLSISYTFTGQATSLSLTGHAPALEVTTLAAPQATGLSLTGYAPTVTAVALWNTSAALASRPATTTATTKVRHRGSGALLSPQPLAANAGKRVLLASADLVSGQASLGGDVWPIFDLLLSTDAVLYARATYIPYEPPTRRMRPQRVNRYAVQLKPSPRHRVRRPNQRIPPK